MLQADDGSRIYYFDVEKEDGKEVFVFNAKKSSEVENYRFDTPVVDGTVFREKE